MTTRLPAPAETHPSHRCRCNLRSSKPARYPSQGVARLYYRGIEAGEDTRPNGRRSHRQKLQDKGRNKTNRGAQDLQPTKSSSTNMDLRFELARWALLRTARKVQQRE